MARGGSPPSSAAPSWLRHRSPLLPVSLGLLLLSPALFAAPPDARLELKSKQARLEKVPSDFTITLVDAPAVVHAELLPSGELLLDPLTAGEARVFLFAPRLVRVIEVAVDRPLAVPAPAPTGPCQKPHIDKACYAAWVKRLANLPASEQPQLDFEIEGVQEQAKAAKALLTGAGLAHITVGFSPFGVRLKGAKDAAEKRRALIAIWPAVLGPMRLDD